MDAKQRMTAISCLILILLTSSCTPPVQKTLSPSEVPPTRIVLPTVPLSITPEPVGTPISIPVLNAPPLQLEVITEANAPYLTTLEDIRFRDDEWPDQAAFSSLGPYLIIVIKNAYGELPTAVVRARTIGTGEIVSQIEVPSNVLINPDGLHVTAYDQHVYVLEAIGGKVAADEQPSVSASQPGVWFSPDGTLLAIGDVAGLEVWDIQQNTRASKLQGLGRITAAAFTQDNSRLAIIDSGNVSVYDIKTGERISEIPAAGADGEFSIRDAMLSPDGAYLAIMGIASDAAGFQLWDVNNATRISNWNSEISGSKAGEMLFSPDGQWLAYS
ncbi:MAG TPA: WD40 repeat domain-containing protein, partial [Anaerolineales bacterium]|nr:WD40 repeat domain-containing protein [Anaerolineales bacterium]